MNVTRIMNPHQANSWQQQLAYGFSDITALCQYLQIAIDKLPVSVAAHQSFPLRVPRGYAECMQQGNPSDPLLRQVLPINEEMVPVQGFSHDPVGDLNAGTVPGVIHKYHGRALLITTGSCAINCRYCFRRNFPYTSWQLSQQKQAQAVDYINKNPEITEVILSGGDPLLLNNRQLSVLLQQLCAIPHLQRIRIHSRIPIVLPARIDHELLDTLNRLPQQIIMVVHCNHTHEISAQVASTCALMAEKQITLLNQSVLLKGVNDNTEQLCQLSEKLFATGIMPYYLHLLDKATGTHHFEVSDDRASEIMRGVQNRLPGYLVPKLVREQAGAAAKTLLPV